jgi:hypothetical protein
MNISRKSRAGYHRIGVGTPRAHQATNKAVQTRVVVRQHPERQRLGQWVTSGCAARRHGTAVLCACARGILVEHAERSLPERQLDACSRGLEVLVDTVARAGVWQLVRLHARHEQRDDGEDLQRGQQHWNDRQAARALHDETSGFAQLPHRLTRRLTSLDWQGDACAGTR